MFKLGTQLLIETDNKIFHFYSTMLLRCNCKYS